MFCLTGAVLRWWSFVPIPTWWQIAAAVILPAVCGAIFGACRHCSWRSAAAAVDSHYQFKDQATTAIAFLLSDQMPPLYRLQIQQAEGCLNAVDTGRVSRCRIPRSLLCSCGLILAACVFWMYPKTAASIPLSAVTPPRLDLVADQIAADLQQLEQLAELSGVSELEPVLRELAEQLQQLRNSDLQPTTTLAAISEMQQKLAARQAQFNLSVTNSQLQALAEALAEADAFRSAAEQLQAQEFSKSARSLEKIRPQRIGSEEARAAEARLAEVAQAMQQAGLSELSEVVAELSDHLGQQSNTATHDAAVRDDSQRLAHVLDQHQRSHDIADLLKTQIRRMSEYKKLARGSGADEKHIAGQHPGSSQIADGSSSSAGRTSSGDQSSDGGGGGGSNAGASTVGNTTGQLTELESRRQLARLTGQLTKRGVSERESVTAFESDQQPRRSQQDVFAEYQLRSQNAVNSENIPLSHRETIRRYFESLRPLADHLSTPDQITDRTGQDDQNAAPGQAP